MLVTQWKVYLWGLCCCVYLPLKCTQPCKLYYILVTAFLQAFITKFDWEALAFNLRKRRSVNAPLQCIVCNLDLPFPLIVYSHYRVNCSVHTIEKNRYMVGTLDIKLLNFSVHTKADQIANVNAPT